MPEGDGAGKPNLKTFLGSLAVVSEGHKEEGTGLIKPEKVRDEIMNKLTAIVNLPDALDEGEKGQWRVAGLRKLLELYPEQRGFMREQINGEGNPRVARALAGLKSHLSIFDEEESNG